MAYPKTYQDYLKRVREPKIRALKLSQIKGEVSKIKVTNLVSPKIAELTDYEEDLLVKFLITLPDDLTSEFLLYVLDNEYELSATNSKENQKIESFLARKEFQKYKDNTLREIEK